jgi:hypothetical protein
MSPKLSDIGFRILTTNDFLFGFFSQFLLPILKGWVVAQFAWQQFEARLFLRSSSL